MTEYLNYIHVQNINKDFTYSGTGEIRITKLEKQAYKRTVGTALPFNKICFSLTEESSKKDIEAIVKYAKTLTEPSILVYYATDQKADQQNSSLGIADDVATPINYGRMDEETTSREDYDYAMFNIAMAEFPKHIIKSNSERIALYMHAELKDTVVAVARFDGKTLFFMEDVAKNLFDRFRFTCSRKPFGMSLGDYHKVCTRGVRREALNEYALHSAEVLVINEDAMFCYNKDCRKPFIYLEKEIKEQAPTKSHPRKQAKRPEAFYNTKYAICPHCGRVHTRREFDDSREYIENVLMPRAFENLEKGLKKPELGTKTKEGFKIRSQRKVAEIEINDAPVAPTEELTKAGPIEIVTIPEKVVRPSAPIDFMSFYRSNIKYLRTVPTVEVNPIFTWGRKQSLSDLIAESKETTKRLEEARRIPSRRYREAVAKAAIELNPIFHWEFRQLQNIFLSK